MERIIVIADSETALAFRLAGVSETHALEGKEAERQLEKTLAAPDAGIVVITERMLAEMDWRLKKRIDGIAKPVVIAVPDKTGASAEAESLRGLVKKALGFDIAK
jgi:V/A-type H+-transporting ATPase subunit F